MKLPSPAVRVTECDDGSILLESPFSLGEVFKTLPHLFDATAQRHASRPFMRQRLNVDGPWREVTYGETLRATRGLAQWLIDQELQIGDCVAYLSAPSIEHGIANIGAQRAGVAFAPLSVAYSLNSSDHAVLKECVQRCKARIAFVDDATRFAPALRALATLGLKFVALTGSAPGVATAAFADVIATMPTEAVNRRMEAIGLDTIARIMHTAGSTGSPKATPQCQSNLTITVAQTESVGLLDFGDEGPQFLEAMPFSHIMAGNFNFNNLIRAGGTLWFDEGKPTPQLFHRTVQNLRDVSPHYFLTVPLGYVMLCDALEADKDLCRKFFRHLRYLGFGGAVLPEAERDRLMRLSRQATGRELPILSFYGATEYLFGALKWWPGGGTDVIGLPLPATQLKLVPIEDRFELRVRAPTLMPRSGYLGASAQSAALFDTEGFYRTGDAVRFANPDDHEEGLVFAGRLSEDFKLSSGTYVMTAAMRTEFLNATAPLIREIVFCGLNETCVGALLWIDDAATRTVLGLAPDVPTAELVCEPKVRQLVANRIRQFNAANPASSRSIGVAVIEVEPLSFDARELTDKGNVSAVRVRETRRESIAGLYATPPATGVLDFRRRS